MNLQLVKQGLRMAAIAAAAAASMNAHAGLVTWTIAGPGTSSATQSGADASLTYSRSGSSVYSTNTWQIRAVADTAGDFTFDWDYSGFHAFFNVRAFMTTTLGDTLVNAGPANCCNSPSAGFSYSGTYTFTGLSAGQSFGFNVGGSNGDSDARLLGTVALHQVPEPASLALVGLALLGVAASRRKV